MPSRFSHRPFIAEVTDQADSHHEAAVSSTLAAGQWLVRHRRRIARAAATAASAGASAVTTAASEFDALFQIGQFDLFNQIFLVELVHVGSPFGRSGDLPPRAPSPRASSVPI